MTAPVNPAVEPEDLRLTAGTVPAWKVARLQFDGDAIGFGAYTSGLTYGVHDLSRCHRNPGHVPPEPGCRCGFYAWRYRQLATPLLWATTPALVEVELFGRVDTYAFGHVAAAQRVRRIDLLPVCGDCLLDARCTPADGVFAWPGADWIRPFCSAHARPHGLASVADLASFVGVEVGWLPLTPVLQFQLAVAQQHTAGPWRYRYGQVADLQVDDVGHVFVDHVGVDGDGRLWVRPDAPLIQPHIGIDIAVRGRPHGGVDALLEGVRLPASAWSEATDAHTVPLVPVGDPVVRPEAGGGA